MTAVSLPMFSEEEIGPVREFLQTSLQANIDSHVNRTIGRNRTFTNKNTAGVPSYDVVVKSIKTRDDPEMLLRLLVALCSHTSSIIASHAFRSFLKKKYEEQSWLSTEAFPLRFKPIFL
jgi:hypothetical protein